MNPRIEAIQMPTMEKIRGQDIWNNCAIRSGVSGYCRRGIMGMFLGALDNPIMQEEMTTTQQIVYQAKQMGRWSWSSCKTFVVMGLLFSVVECTVEKVLLILRDDNHVNFCSHCFTIFLFIFRTKELKLEILLTIRIRYF
ncbi:hypothetical protein RDI58_019761 [Solanum bulbocastanum]|uniref:Uncharacterized protein n=1 Tax=Solanum bulbocastanum TaxID=147425 RepID=A0AAN8T7B9_SOLBU